ncbi:hypothetical protein Tco_0569778 [Tanacetum coccineum]
MSSRTLPATRKSLKSLCSSSDAEVFRKILDICPRVQGEDFTEVPDDDSTLTFFIDLGYKGLLYKHPSMFVDHMHRPWRTLAAIINKCLSGKTASNDRLRKSRIDILRGMFYRENVDYPELIWEDFAIQIDNGQLKKGIREIMPYPRVLLDVHKILHWLNPSQKEQSCRVIKKKVSISTDDNIIPEPDVALELGKSMSLSEAAEEEVARQVYATHERIVIESDPEPARRRPSGIAFRDTSSVSKKMSPGLSQKLKGVQTLTLEEKLVADTMQALKESKKNSRRHPNIEGSSEGIGRIPGVLDESTGIMSTSSEGTGTKPGVSDEEKDTSVAKADVTLDWRSEEESEYTKEDDDDENIEWVDPNEDEEKNDDDDCNTPQNHNAAEYHLGATS